MRANIKKHRQCRFLFYILHKSHYEYITIYTEIYLIEFLFHFMKFYFSSFDCVYMHIISLNMFFTFSLSLKKIIRQLIVVQTLVYHCGIIIILATNSP